MSHYSINREYGAEKVADEIRAQTGINIFTANKCKYYGQRVSVDVDGDETIVRTKVIGIKS